MPRVSIILPVYNSAAFVQAAILSIVQQSFTDFELIIIDDGSTDASATVIEKISDPRIIVSDHSKNLGLVATLNEAVRMAKGEYIARMDADDISLPERLSAQVAFLDQNPKVSVSGVSIQFMNQRGRITGPWELDRYQTPEQIRRFMPRANCLAHPGIMARAQVLRAHPYDPAQKAAEDYDLWLRLLAEGHRLAKLPEILLSYRVHASQITAIASHSHPLNKNIAMKWRYIKKRFPHFRFFDGRVFLFWLFDILVRVGSPLKQAAMNVIMKGLAGIGYICGKLIPMNIPSRHIFFFPYYHVGGAEIVHSEIVKAVSESHPLVIFTYHSRNEQYLPLFQKYATVWDLSTWLSNPLGYCVGQGVMAAILNRQKGLTLFASNSSFFYRMVPWLHTTHRLIDLVHAFDGGIEFLSLGVVPRLDNRIVINHQTELDMYELYNLHNLQKYEKRVQLIENAVPVPSIPPKKQKEMKVIFIGRGAVEKRVHVVAEVAQRAHLQKLPTTFTLLGDVQNVIPSDLQKYCHLLGEVSNISQRDQYLDEADVLLLTSSREGFPMVVMEAMAHAVIPICTNVGGLADHIKNGENGFLVDSGSEEQIVQDILKILTLLAENPQLRATMAKNTHAYAKSHFNPERFAKEYQGLIPFP